jgi:ankyrin repeat protein
MSLEDLLTKIALRGYTAPDRRAQLAALLDAGETLPAEQNGLLVRLVTRLEVDELDLVVKRLGLDVNVMKWGDRPLVVAAGDASLDVMRRLLDLGADPTLADDVGLTPLHTAASAASDRVARVELLLEHGASLHATSSIGNTPLHAAAESGHEDAIALLLDRGASVAPENTDGATPYKLARKAKVSKPLLGRLKT